jgi:hypothetical protein
LNFWTSASGNGSSHPRAVYQVFIGRIHDCIAYFSGNIALYQLKGCAGGKGCRNYRVVHQNILPPLNIVGATGWSPLRFF